jgi:transposase
MVDTQGWMLHLRVHEANLQDHHGGQRLLASLREHFPRLERIWADSAYKKGGFIDGVKERFGWMVEVGDHPWAGLRYVWAKEDAVIDWEPIRPRGFHGLQWRWMVERTFAWLATWRRLTKAFDLLPESEEAWISLAMSRLMLRRLAL